MISIHYSGKILIFRIPLLFWCFLIGLDWVWVRELLWTGRPSQKSRAPWSWYDHVVTMGAFLYAAQIVRATGCAIFKSILEIEIMKWETTTAASMRTSRLKVNPMDSHMDWIPTWIRWNLGKSAWRLQTIPLPKLHWSTSLGQASGGAKLTFSMGARGRLSIWIRDTFAGLSPNICYTYFFPTGKRTGFPSSLPKPNEGWALCWTIVDPMASSQISSVSGLQSTCTARSLKPRHRLGRCWRCWLLPPLSIHRPGAAWRQALGWDGRRQGSSSCWANACPRS